MKNQDSKITDTLPFKQEEYTKDVEEYMKSPTEDLFYKLRKYRKQCIEYLKRHPDDFNMQTNLIDLNYLGISKSKPPVKKGIKILGFTLMLYTRDISNIGTVVQVIKWP